MNSSVSIRWSPHSTPDNQRFLKINSTQQELCLYDLAHEKGNKGTAPQCRLVSKHSKVPYIRCFDWSPTQEDLVSVGQSSGETLLYRLSTRASIPLRVKHQRSCNSVSFNSSGALLATALDKVRNDFCLNIWDIAASHLSANQGGIARPSWQLASSEAIPSVRFLRKDPDVLICGVSYRWIRCYDIRKSPVTTVFAVPHRCAHGLSLDLDSNYFASHSDDGVIAVWDRRHISYGGPAHEPRPALLFNRAEEYGRQGSPIASLRYSNTKPGTFAVLNTSGGLRIYDTGKIADGDPPLGQGLFGPGVIAGVQTSGRKGWRDSAASLLDGARMNGGGGTNSGARTPNLRVEPGETLFVTRIKDIQTTPVRTAKNDRRIVSFDWMSDCGSEDIRTICLRNDGTPVVMSCSGSATSLAFGSRNGLLITHGKDLKVLPSPSTAPSLPAETDAEEASVDSPVGSPPGAGMRLGMHEGRRLGRSNSIARPEDFLYDAAEMLKNDICVIMRRRVEAGYEMDCAKNITLVPEEPELQEMWQWLQGATEAAAGGGMVGGILDLSYMGVLGIWNNGTGLGTSAITNLATRNLSSPPRTPTQADWTAAIAEINRRAKRSPFTGRTKFPEQRRLALAISGWDFAPSELEAQLSRLEAAGEFAKAAGWALFHGETERCIATLGRGGQQMKIMSTAVAGYYSHATSSAAGATATATAESVKNAGIWKELCRAMSVELDEPYLRAVFAYVANGEWRDVLDDVGLPIRERLGIALRWLEDAELTVYLGGLAERVVGDGDVDGVVLTGVGGKIGELLQVYVNRKGDVQTASLVAGLAVPRYDEDERVGYWVESYRQLLNSWRLFHARAKFDVARGKHSRNRAGVMTVPEVQRQVYVRCTYCDRNISYGAPTPTAKPAGTSKPHMNPREITQAPTSLAGVNAATKATVCPQCKKSLPRCAVCLLNLGTKYYKKSAEGGVVRGAEDGKSSDPGGEFDRWFNFCLSCNHGMHSGHAREWFARHVLCPVPECDCRCKM
ncbi:hypothetical protein P167DRAFT_571494 [Morchella conica CCBAS932]|uniref:Uncharacterized protein n=1 Tax=Morchella conica CCBAS932 TaxID=1392247 RepID=A0A3N4L457_9PEZI|nr:hypothetical protein P167DRAFT_571494 [Morchella conica CCBAS932]